MYRDFLRGRSQKSRNYTYNEKRYIQCRLDFRVCIRKLITFIYSLVRDVRSAYVCAYITRNIYQHRATCLFSRFIRVAPMHRITPDITFVIFLLGCTVIFSEKRSKIINSRKISSPLSFCLCIYLTSLKL